MLTDYQPKPSEERPRRPHRALGCALRKTGGVTGFTLLTAVREMNEGIFKTGKHVVGETGPSLLENTEFCRKVENCSWP